MGLRTYACRWAQVSPSTPYVYVMINKEKSARDTGFIEQRKGRVGVLCHEYVIHADDEDLVDALRLELVILLDVSRRLRVACRRESPRHANLFHAQKKKFMKSLGKIVGERLGIIATITCINAIHETKGRERSGGARERAKAE